MGHCCDARADRVPASKSYSCERDTRLPRCMRIRKAVKSVFASCQDVFEHVPHPASRSYRIAATRAKGKPRSASMVHCDFSHMPHAIAQRKAEEIQARQEHAVAADERSSRFACAIKKAGAYQGFRCRCCDCTQSIIIKMP